MRVRAVTFDVYTALFETPGSLTRAVTDLFAGRRGAEDPGRLAQLWRQKHREYLLVANSLEREPASNREAIEAATRYALRSLTPPPTPDELRALVRAWEHLRPWPDAVEVLQAVRRRSVLVGALSNGDAAMLRALFATVPMTFDRVISTEGGKFKPHPWVYRKALEELGARADEVLHVAGSPADAMGAAAAGVPTVWVNRTGDAILDPRYRPAHEVADLRGVLPLLETA
ncbi:MAG: haloacid dehalogenase type II [Candidatus Rokubacteria bacterium]|nr:haloacid dehalogenase type II [Candidatus Rokubacteria bacterium]